MNFIILASSFLLLFGFAEILYHFFGYKAEFTRKVVHIGTGIITLLFPVMLGNHWLVLLLSVSFLVILCVSLWYNFLPSINAIERFSVGSLLYPCAVYVAYLAYNYEQNKLYYFYLPMLSLALCDPLAEIVGRRFPIKKFKVLQSTKSLGGFLAFFVGCFVLSFFILNAFSIENLWFKMLLIAFFTAFVEAMSGKGMDNITIPVCVIVCLKIF